MMPSNCGPGPPACGIGRTPEGTFAIVAEPSVSSGTRVRLTLAWRPPAKVPTPLR